MRKIFAILPLALAAAPALSAEPAKPAPPAIPKELTDPATADRLTTMMDALSKAFLELPVGEIEAAAEGRAATPADKQRKVRDLTDQEDLQRGLAESRVAMQAGMKALVAALPAMMQGMSAAARELEKAAANMPRPDYPKR